MTTLVANWFSLIGARAIPPGTARGGSHSSEDTASKCLRSDTQSPVEPDVTYSAGGPTSILAP